MRLWLALLLFFAHAAGAGVTPLPGATPQQAMTNEWFPGTVAVRVTDTAGRPVPSAWVRWTLNITSPLAIQTTASVVFDAGWNYTAVTDADGVAVVGRLRALLAGAHRLRVYASTGMPPHESLGETTIVLEAGALGDVPLLDVVSGLGQAAEEGTLYPEPIVVRLRRRDGSPIAGMPVRFGMEPLMSATQAWAQYVETDAPLPVTDAQGYARSPRIVARRHAGTVAGTATYLDAQASWATVTATFTLEQRRASAAPARALQDMWWVGPEENGWGLAIAERDGRLFTVVFAYDAAGRPTWWVAPSGRFMDRAPNGQEIYFADLYQPRSAPFHAYDASRFRLGERTAHMRLELLESRRLAYFSAHEVGTFAGAASMRALIGRMDFSTDEPMTLTGVGGLWWGGMEQNGWGLSVMEQRGMLFCVWLTYGDDGRPTWFAMPSGRWEGMRWTGALYRTSGTAFFQRPYDPSRFTLDPAGEMSIDFTGSEAATLRWRLGDRAGSVPIVKQGF